MKTKPTDTRQDLVDRYNEALGPPGPQVAALQASFLDGSMASANVLNYVQQCEYMIEARISLRRKSPA